MKLFNNMLHELLNERFEELKENKVKIKFIGRLRMFPETLKNLMNELEEKTNGFDKYRVNICLSYGGQEELIDAINKILGEKLEKINIEKFPKYLYLNSQPDIIIRTGGERRLSNFLTWQSVYSELFFLDVMWPDFSEEDFQKVIREYKSRERRFGR